MLRLRKDIPLFPHGLRKAFTLSSDDGVSQDQRLTELMRKYGIRGTFHLNSGLMGDRDRLIQQGIDVSHYKLKREEITGVYDGFEVAVHTMTHPDLTRLPSSSVIYEIAENKKELEDLVRHPVEGMSYPFGTWNDQVKQLASSCGIAYSRTIDCTNAFDLPDDYLAWNPTCHYCDKERFDLGEKFLTDVKAEEYKSPMCFYVWGHAYQLDACNDWDDLEKFFSFIGGHEEVWYASNIEICAYMKAVKNLVYSSSGEYIQNPSCLDVWMQIDNQVYCIKSGETISVDWQHTDD